ncbi:MAG: STAS domain-containing protein [Candidatus Gallimonas sp.]
MQEVKLIGRSPALTVALSGEIDSGNAGEMYDTVMDVYRAEPSDVVFDCKELQFIDSTTLGTFVKLFKHVRSDGYAMKFVGMRERLKKLFVICKLDTIMEIEP